MKQPFYQPLRRLHILFLIAAAALALDCRITVADTKEPIFTEENWTGFYFKGKKMGFSSALVKEFDDAVHIQTKTFFRLRAGDVDQVTSFNQETELDKEYKPRRFFLVQELSGGRMKVKGRLERGKLLLEEESSGYRKEKSVDFPENAVLSAVSGLAIERRGLAVGKKERLPVFIEAFRLISPLDYEIVRREMIEFQGGRRDVFVIEQKLAGMESTIWMTPEGEVLRELSQDGFESRAESREEAQRLGSNLLSVGSPITLSVVRPSHSIKTPDFKTRLKLQLSNLSDSSQVPEDHRQAVQRPAPPANRKTAVLTVRTEEREVRRPATLASLASFPEREFLQDSPEIQSSHPLIRSLAKDIVGKTDDAWKAARSINDWVSKNLEKSLMDTMTAVDTLRARRGECQAHTNLYVALARSVGIPAKVVMGLVYSKEYDGFVYHAWPEVYVGEWRTLDPTLGQTYVDATHIKLAEGENEGQMKIMGFIGKLQIEVLDD